MVALVIDRVILGGVGFVVRVILGSVGGIAAAPLAFASLSEQGATLGEQAMTVRAVDAAGNPPDLEKGAKRSAT